MDRAVSTWKKASSPNFQIAISNGQLKAIKLKHTMTAEEMRVRTKQFALRVLKWAESLPKSVSGRTLGNQIARSGTSVAANYRAAGKARSKAEFVAKLGIAEEEADETQFWLEMIVESGLVKLPLVQPLQQEARDLTAIIAASRISASKARQTGN